VGLAFLTPIGGVFTSKKVMYKSWPILLVSHDAEDEAWQFVNGHGDTEYDTDGMIVLVDEVLELDASIALVADLPLGWRAWRETANHDWIREPKCRTPIACPSAHHVNTPQRRPLDD
jgi:hypothetical protein